MTIPGLENKNHFPWLFQAADTLNEWPVNNSVIKDPTVDLWCDPAQKLHTLPIRCVYPPSKLLSSSTTLAI